MIMTRGFLGVAWTISTFVAGQDVSPTCHGGDQCDEDGSSASPGMFQVDNVKNIIAVEVDNEEIVADSKSMVSMDRWSLDSLGMRARENDTDEDGQAKDLAISSVCNIYTVSAQIENFFIEADSNEDGSLSKDELTGIGVALDADADGDADGVDGDASSKATFLNNTLHPLIESLVVILENHSSALAFDLSNRVRELAGIIQEGGNPADFLEVCDIFSAGEPEVESATDGGDEPPVSLQEISAADSLQAEEEDDESVSYNASLFKVLSKKEKKASNMIAWQSVMKSVNKLYMADYCWKDVWARGSSGRHCKSGWYQGGSVLDAGFCYQHCKSGWRRFGDHCWRDCPSNMNDLGTHCQREYWGRCCHNFGWPVGNVCVHCIQIQVQDKAPYHLPGCSITSDHCSGCPAHHDPSGWLCYKRPADYGKPEYRCTEAALTCSRDCTDHIAHDCAAGCALDLASCVTNTVEMVAGVLEAVVQTTVLVMSLGTASAVTAMGSATKAAMKNAAKKNARRNAVMVSKASFKAELRKARKKVIKDAIEEAIRGKIEEKRTELMTNYAIQGAEGMSEAFMAKVEKQGKDPALIAVKEVDPTGIADAIDSSVSGDESANKLAAKWLTVISVVDPTGILGAVANFIKHDHCESTIAAANAKAIADTGGELKMAIDAAIADQPPMPAPAPPPPLACMAPSTLLRTQDGPKALSSFRRGDSVGQYSARITAEGAVDVVSEGHFHVGFMLGWAIRATDRRATFLKFTTARGRSAAVTEDHYLLVKAQSGGELHKASDVNVGDLLACGDAFTNRTVTWDAIEKKEEVDEVGMLDPLFVSHGGNEGDLVQTASGLLLPIYSGASAVGIDASAQHSLFHSWMRKMIPTAAEHPCLFKELPSGLIITGLMRAYLSFWKESTASGSDGLQTYAPHELDSFGSLMNASKVAVESSASTEDLERHLAVCQDVAEQAGVDVNPKVVRHMETMRQQLKSMGPQSDEEVRTVLKELLARTQQQE